MIALSAAKGFALVRTEQRGVPSGRRKSVWPFEGMVF